MRRECRESFPRHRLRNPLVSDPDMHHGTCVTHVPWCMSGSLTRGDGENFPGIPGACVTRNFAYLARGPWVVNGGHKCCARNTSITEYSTLCIINMYPTLISQIAYKPKQAQSYNDGMKLSRKCQDFIFVFDLFLPGNNHFATVLCTVIRFMLALSLATCFIAKLQYDFKATVTFHQWSSLVIIHPCLVLTTRIKLLLTFPVTHFQRYKIMSVCDNNIN